MRRILLALLLCAVFVLAACAPLKSAEQRQAQPVQESSSNEEFEITIFADKGLYSENEAVQCYAELKYLGDESITVYSGNPLLGFGVKDGVYFDGSYVTNDSLERSEFAPGETVRFDFVKSGGYTSDDPLVQFYKEYYAERELKLPSGVYEISAGIDYSLDVEDMLGSRKKLSVSVTITVE